MVKNKKNKPLLLQPVIMVLFYLPLYSLKNTCFKILDLVSMIGWGMHVSKMVLKNDTPFAVIRKEEMIMGHCGPIITTFNGPFQCSLGKN